MAALYYVIDALLMLVVVAFLLRAIMPLVRADFRNPLGQAVLRFTDPIVRPLRRVVKPVGRVDVASFIALVLVQLAATAVLGLFAGADLTAGMILAGGMLALIRTVLQFYSLAILVYALLSWVAPGAYSPATRLLSALCEPLLEPIRRLLPPMAGLDLSPLFVLIALQALQILLR